MPATQKPVRTRSGIAIPPPPLAATSVFAAAAPSVDTKNTCRAEYRSDRFVIAETTAPVTNPSWTAIESHADSPVDSDHAARSCGSTAAAENQVVIARTIATASKRRELRADPVRSSVMDLAERRRAKDDYFGKAHDSPLTVTQRQHFDGLRYFDSDPAFRFEVVLEGGPVGVEEVEMSDGTTDHLQRAGTLQFSVDGNDAS